MAPRHARPTRQYSRDFTPGPATKRRRIIIDKIPADLHDTVKAKAKREGASIRALVLTYLQHWSVE